jgi:histidyl-tRNA synthetase
VLPADPSAESFCSRLAYDLRQQNHRVELLLSGNVGKKMKRASKMAARFAIIVGESELNQKAVMLKDLNSGDQKLVATADLKSSLENS